MQIEHKCQQLLTYSGSQKNIPVLIYQKNIPVLTTLSWAPYQLLPILFIITDAYTSVISFKTAEQ